MAKSARLFWTKLPICHELAPLFLMQTASKCPDMLSVDCLAKGSPPLWSLPPFGFCLCRVMPLK